MAEGFDERNLETVYNLVGKEVGRLITDINNDSDSIRYSEIRKSLGVSPSQTDVLTALKNDKFELTVKDGEFAIKLRK